MKHFDIHPVNRSLETAIQAKIDNLNKPKGALGRLEEIAMQVSLIQESLTPSLAHPCHLLFGGDHGIEREGVSVSPREVTWQQMINFTHGMVSNCASWTLAWTTTCLTLKALSTVRLREAQKISATRRL